MADEPFKYAKWGERQELASSTGKQRRDEESFTITFDLTSLDTKQRETMLRSLEQFARGLGPDLGRLVASEGDPHLSHRDTDGWF